METIELSAYHESGRIVMAYIQGFFCEKSELSSEDIGSGKTIIQGGEQMPLVQAVLQRNSGTLVTPNSEHIAIAYKLLYLFAAGSCSSLFINNDKKLDENLEITFPGGDYAQIDLLMNFLNRHDPNYNEESFQRILTELFNKLERPEYFKAIETLANAFLKTENHTLDRRQIESVLHSQGLKMPVEKKSIGFNVSVSEDNSKPELRDKNEETEDNSLILDSVLKKFIKTLNPNLDVEEVAGAIEFLKDAFKKLG